MGTYAESTNWFRAWFLKDKILFYATYARNRSSNMLLSYQLPSIVGQNNIYSNFPATIQNTNWEFLGITENIKSSVFSWTSQINLTIPKNKLIAFANLSTTFPYRLQYIIGEDIRITKVTHFMGVDPATGVYMVESKTDPFNPVSPDDYTRVMRFFHTIWGYSKQFEL